MKTNTQLIGSVCVILLLATAFAVHPVDARPVVRPGPIVNTGMPAGINPCKGDVNNDGRKDFFDIDPFNMVRENQNFMKKYHSYMFWRADMNDDKQVDEADVDGFLSAVFAQNQQACPASDIKRMAAQEKVSLSTEKRLLKSYVKKGIRGDTNRDKLVNFFDTDLLQMSLKWPTYMKQHHPYIAWASDVNANGELENPEDADAFFKIAT